MARLDAMRTVNLLQGCSSEHPLLGKDQLPEAYFVKLRQWFYHCRRIIFRPL